MKVPMQYDCYAFDFYGTLVDIHTEESAPFLWEKLSLFYGYYGALYTPEELRRAYEQLVRGKEAALKVDLEKSPRYTHEASPEIDQKQVFLELFRNKGAEADETLAIHAGQFFRVLATDRLQLYPGTREMLEGLRKAGKKCYLLSNAQRIFTEYEMHVLDIARWFNGILISSDYGTRKPDRRFFDILLERYQLDPKKTLFLGNDSTTDIAGARTVGMPTCYVHSNISPEGDCPAVSEYCDMAFTGWELP